MTNEEIHAQGGPAYPVSIPGSGDNGWHGMTLLDYFAGQAFKEMLRWEAAEGMRYEEISEQAYMAAQTMIDWRTYSAQRNFGIKR